MNLTAFMEKKKQEAPAVEKTEGKVIPIKTPTKRSKTIPVGERNTTLSRRAGQILKRNGDTAGSRRRFDELCASCEERLSKAEEDTIYLSAQKFFHNTVEKSPTYIEPGNYDSPSFAILTDRGYVISAPLLADYYLERHTVIIETDSGSPRLYEYQNGVYQFRTNLEVRAELGNYINAFRRGLWQSGKITEAYSAIIHATPLHVSQKQLNSNPDLVCLVDGLLNLKNWRLLPHDPKIYITRQLDCCFTDIEIITENFDKYLNRLCENDCAKIQFILQFMGVVFSSVPGWMFKRFLLIIGLKDSGKTIIKRLMEIFVGEGNYNNCDLYDLETNRFALASLQHKRLSGSNDLRAVRIPESSKLKQLSGGDSMRAERKGEQDFSMLYDGFICAVGNERPLYGGKSDEALYQREILFEVNHSIPLEEQDHHMMDKLLAEKQGIILKALKASRKAIYDNDYRFDIPAECERSKVVHRLDNSVVSQFMQECTEEIDLKTMTVKQSELQTAAKVWSAFKRWRESCNEYKGITRNDFEREMAVVCGVDLNHIKDIQHSGNIVGRFYPVKLNNDGLTLNGNEFLQ